MILVPIAGQFTTFGKEDEIVGLGPGVYFLPLNRPQTCGDKPAAI
jgi:hypothetical protein